MISAVGEIKPGLFSPDYFKLLENSPVIGKGTDNTEIVKYDYFGTKRTAPLSIGAIEYNSD